MRRRLIAVYAVLCPGPSRGMLSWFHRECLKHGVVVSQPSISRYVNGERKTELTATVEGVLGVLEADAVLSLESTLDGLKRGMR